MPLFCVKLKYMNLKKLVGSLVACFLFKHFQRLFCYLTIDMHYASVLPGSKPLYCGETFGDSKSVLIYMKIQRSNLEHSQRWPLDL